jgi:hypothetical protein
MVLSYRCSDVFWLQLLALVLFICSAAEPVSHLLQISADAGQVQPLHNSQGLSLECDGTGADTIEFNDLHSPEYPGYFGAALLSVTTRVGRLFIATFNHALPLIFLPIFSPPKIVTPTFLV